MLHLRLESAIPVEDIESKFIASELASGNIEILIGRNLELKPTRKTSFTNTSDFYWLTPEGLLCTERTMNALIDITEGCGKWSEMTLNEKPVFFFSVTMTIEALDYDKTSFIEYNKIVVGIRNYVFLDDVCENFPIFRTQLKRDYPVVSQKFVDIVRSNSLTGLDFKLLK